MFKCCGIDEFQPEIKPKKISHWALISGGDNY